MESLLKDIDGANLREYLTSGNGEALENRPVVVTNQRVYEPSKQRPTSILQGDWRYISQAGSKALYNLKQDPQQKQDVSQQYPEKLAAFETMHNDWWQKATKQGFEDRYIHVGNDAENPVRLNAMDWMEVSPQHKVPWFIGHQSPAPEWDYIHWLTRE